MKGLKLSEAYYREYGKPMLEGQFAELLPFLAVGLFGAGSECFGYDDEVSQDHDFEPGFCIFLPGEDIVDRRSAFLLERAYDKLPREFLGFRREILAPVGGRRKGVLRTAEFFQNTVGSPNGELSLEHWLTVPEQGLAEATNGHLFFDEFGEVSRIRKSLRYFPEDIRLKRLSGNLLLMAQSGIYNFRRCLAHSEPAAAQLAVFQFAESTASVAFLLNRIYQPFYKWRFRALRSLPTLGGLADVLEQLICSTNSGENAVWKQSLIDKTVERIICKLIEDGLIGSAASELEDIAYEINARISEPNLRNMHILAAI